VRAGTTVVWINTGTQVQDVNAYDGSFPSGALNPGQVFIFTFANPGPTQAPGLRDAGSGLASGAARRTDENQYYGRMSSSEQ
jgi:hypothetical protein